MERLAVVEPMLPLARPLTDTTTAEAELAAAFDRELPLVEGAITLVASGAVPRVTLVGMGGGLPLARLAKGLARRAKVTVLARRHPAADRPDDPRVDLIVEWDG